MTTAAKATDRFWFRPVPLARIAVFRTIAYLFIPIDVFVTTAWVKAHAAVPTEWYEPLLIGRLLHLPTPTSAADSSRTAGDTGVHCPPGPHCAVRRCRPCG